jgi:hypothetical protein
MAQFDTLYHKVLTDKHFRDELVHNPDKALESIGITPTPEILKLLKDIENAVVALEEDLDGTAETAMVT